MVPAADLVRFTNSGTEAVMAALALRARSAARTATSWSRAASTASSTPRSGRSGPRRTRRAGSSRVGAGVPEVLRDLVNIVPLNDANRLEDVLKRRGDSIGAFLIEPILGNAGSITADEQYHEGRARIVRPVRRRHAHRRGQDRLPRRARRRAGADERARRSVHVREGAGQRLSDLGARGTRGDHAEDRRRKRRGPGRDLRGALRAPRRRGEDPRDPGRDRHPRADRELRPPSCRRA